MGRLLQIVAVSFAMSFAGPVSWRGLARADAPPEGVQQLLPRGAIPAVFEPRFVPAAEADIPGDAWVLGIAIGDVAKAYSLNLLNHHEIVNDRLGARAIAAVW